MANESSPSVVMAVGRMNEFFEDMSPFLAKNIFSDIILAVEGQEIPAHKIVLAARCKFFESLLRRGPTLSKVTIEGVPFKAFEVVLGYIYTGSIITSDIGNNLFVVLELAKKYSLDQMVFSLTEKISQNLDVTNVFTILNNANLHDLDDLVASCHTFVEKNVVKILETENVGALSQKSMVGLLERDSFALPEIQVFEIAAKWCRINKSNVVMECVRLSNLSQDEILEIVWPSQLVEEGKILGTLAGRTPRRPRLCPVPNVPEALSESVENGNSGFVNTPEADSGSVENNNSVLSLTGKEVFVDFQYGVEGQKNFIVVNLRALSAFNHINMKMDNGEFFTYYYYVEVSTDNINWSRILDYGNYDCCGSQKLYFGKQSAQWVRIVAGPRDVTVSNRIMYLEYFRASLKTTIPNMVNQIIRPTRNVATLAMGARVIEGCNTQHLLDPSNPRKYYAGQDPFERIIIQLSQPFLISSVALTLGPSEYAFMVRTSTDKVNWKPAAR